MSEINFKNIKSFDSKNLFFIMLLQFKHLWIQSDMHSIESVIDCCCATFHIIFGLTIFLGFLTKDWLFSD